MNSNAMNFNFGVPYHHKTIEQCRAIGARGGRRSAMNRRQRHLAPPSVPSRPAPDPETVHEASMLLDRQFPWLRGAERQTPRRLTAL
jgi:hypothetical protein